MTEPLNYQFGSKTVLEFQQLQEGGYLNLEPGFQRKSVWTLADRRKLIESVFEGYPVPSIFLYKREDNGRPVYDVLDGKQRLETLFMFGRTRPFGRNGFDVRYRFPHDDETLKYDWTRLSKRGRAADFLGYKLQTVEVSGDLSDIITLFVRINSTGRALTSGEKRHAKFYNSEFLRHAEKLCRKHRKRLMADQIISDQQIARMKDVELVSELLAALATGQPLHSKAAVDKAIGNQSLHGQTLKRVIAEFTSVLGVARKMFPELRSTRFRNSSEFYSLFLVVADLRRAGLILSDRKRNRTAQEILKVFSNEVDEARSRQRHAKGVPAGKQLYVDYLLATQRGTDNLGQRTRRAQIIRGLLTGLFEKKDAKRIFSVEQRRMLWNSEEKRKCSQCDEPLDWTNFQVDHLRPHSRGGRTDLKNAGLICKRCNASKGARKRSRRAV
jgi:5-methylcytosine-specific restriction endonuclease McrA